jgi:methionine-rich copper-binding protein CopC
MLRSFPSARAAALASLSFAGFLALGGSGAFAHALLESASPPVGGTVAAPSEITIHFSEGIEPKFSGVALSGPHGAVPVGKASTAPGDDKTLVVKIGRKLAPGAYTVKWRAVSVDTHRTQGNFDFTVK